MDIDTNFALLDDSDKVIILASDGKLVIQKGYKLIEEKPGNQLMFRECNGEIFFSGQSDIREKNILEEAKK